MATGIELTKARQKFERAVLEAMGFTDQDPVAFHNLDPDEGMMTFFWCAPGEPPLPPYGDWDQVVYGKDMFPRFTVYCGSLTDDQWAAMMAARTEWVSHFFQPDGTPKVDRP